MDEFISARIFVCSFCQMVPLQDIAAADWQPVGHAQPKASAAAHLSHQLHISARLRCRKDRARASIRHRLCQCTPWQHTRRLSKAAARHIIATSRG